MTIPNRTRQYRVNKLGVYRVRYGTFTMPKHVSVAYACGEGAVVQAMHPHQEAFAVHADAEAHAYADGATAYACAEGSRAYAQANGSTAIAMHEGAKAYSTNKGAIAIATMEGARVYRKGARAYRKGTMGNVVIDTIQQVFPRNNRALEMTFS
jgi:hypothetical protein